MLPKCSLTCKIETLTPEKALDLARQTFHNDAVALVEGPIVFHALRACIQKPCGEQHPAGNRPGELPRNRLTIQLIGQAVFGLLRQRHTLVAQRVNVEAFIRQNNEFQTAACAELQRGCSFGFAAVINHRRNACKVRQVAGITKEFLPCILFPK